MNVKAINETTETTEEFVSNEVDIEFDNNTEYELQLEVGDVILNLKPKTGFLKLKKRNV